MSMENLREAFNLIKNNFTAEEQTASTPKAERLISGSEEILGIILPKTYKEFLRKQGFGGVESFIVYGLIDDNPDNLATKGFVWGTLKDRKDCDYPNHIIRLYDVGEGTTYCLDTSQMNEDGECPVVAWPIDGYKQTPVLEVIAEDFGKFFLDMVEEQIKYKKDINDSKSSEGWFI